jgi:hypothetical protein
VAVLLKFFGLHIVAGGHVTAGAKRIVVGKHVMAKRAELRSIPDVPCSTRRSFFMSSMIPWEDHFVHLDKDRVMGPGEVG